MKTHQHAQKGFTLPELLIAIFIFSTVSLVVSTMYVRSFRLVRETNDNNQIYEDARFILGRIADEVRNGMIDYDEYYNQNVVIPTIEGGGSVPGASRISNYGQNYGRYYSSFFYPGSDARLGFDCNDGRRNMRDCTPIRSTIDRNTGENPYPGKYVNGVGDDENAFCANVSYTLNANNNPQNIGLCTGDTPLAPKQMPLNQLYLISNDGTQKTIIAQERIGGSGANPVYALSLLRLKGYDMDNDGVPDNFICAPEFQCRGVDRVTANGVDVSTSNDSADCYGTLMPGDVPRSAKDELYPDDAAFAAEQCDTEANGFNKDFVPISPLRVNVSRLNFIIDPLENPYYAFGEKNLLRQPTVTIVLTVEPNPEYFVGTSSFQPITLMETVSTRVLNRIPAPLLAQ